MAISTFETLPPLEHYRSPAVDTHSVPRRQAPGRPTSRSPCSARGATALADCGRGERGAWEVVAYQSDMLTVITQGAWPGRALRPAALAGRATRSLHTLRGTCESAGYLIGTGFVCPS